MQRIALVVLSCDNYSDLWEYYGSLFNRFWPNCPYDKYFASNFIEPKVDGFSPLTIGRDISWSHGLKNVLDQLSGKYTHIIAPFDDFMLYKKVNTPNIQKCINNFLLIDGNYLCLEFQVRQKLTYYNEYFGELKNNIPYRQTMGFCVWKIDTLYNILKVGESAWEFEKIGVKRGFAYDKFYCTYKSHFKCFNLVIKRKLVPSCYKRLQKLLPTARIDRGFIGKKEMFFKNTLKGVLLVGFIKFVPASWQWTLYSFINKNNNP